MTRVETGPTSEELHVLVQYQLIEALQEREHHLAEAQRLAHVGSWAWDMTTGELTWSDELHRLYGTAPRGFTPTYEEWLSRVHPDDRARVRAIVEQAMVDQEPFEYEHRPLIAGVERVLLSRGAVVVDATGTPVRMLGTAQDVTEARAAEQALRDAERRFVALSQSNTDFVTLFEPNGTVHYSTAAAEHVLGHAPDAQNQLDIWQLVHPDDAEQVRAELAALMGDAGNTMLIAFRVAHADGSWRSVEATGKNALDDPRIQGAFVTIRDTTDRRASEAAFAHQALHDPLTGLANRTLLSDRAGRALARAARLGWSTAVLTIDIDRLGDLNATFGHAAGDRLLAEVAARLDTAFRPSDTVGRPGDTVARFEGDEFVVVCERVADAETAHGLGRRVAAVLEPPVDLGPLGPVAVTASVGICVAPPGAGELDELILDAEAAMHETKAQAPGGAQLFTEGMRQRGRDRAEAEGALRHALDRNELVLHYQPKVALDTDRITGVEALLRWVHPSRGLVPPLEFIPLAEETGLIVPIGAWVIEEACRQAARWRRASPDRPPLTVCVNVSVRQFEPALVSVVAGALANVDLDPGALCLEVTESLLMADVDDAVAILVALAELGVKLSIDDFGTGYSSLAYLKNLPIDELKIDKSFVDGLGTDASDTAIVAAIVGMAHALDLIVVAEGVESADQLARLRTLGCEQAQGYYFSRPEPAAVIDDLLVAEARETWRPHDRRSEPRAGQSEYRPERVLVVDDTPDVRQLARMSLAAVGFEVYEAEDGVTGLAMARDVCPDCIVLDLVMPDMDGTEVCRALRADPATAGCTIVMLTSNADAEDKVGAFSAGADDYIIKPFSPRDLASRVRSAIRRRAGAAEHADAPAASAAE